MKTKSRKRDKFKCKYFRHPNELIDLQLAGYYVLRCSSFKRRHINIICRIDNPKWLEFMQSRTDLPDSLQEYNYKRYYLENFSKDEFKLLPDKKFRRALKGIKLLDYIPKACEKTSHVPNTILRKKVKKST